MPSSSAEEKPIRLLFKTYLKTIKNATDTNLFRNFYVSTTNTGEFDAMQDGVLSCALFVSSLLALFGKISRVHGTVASTIEDLKKSGWQLVKSPKAGDVLVWEKQEIDGDYMEHIGFCISESRAISNSWTKRTPVEHDINFKDTKPRQITHIFRMSNWEDGSRT